MKCKNDKLFILSGALLFTAQFLYAQQIPIDEDKVVQQYPQLSLVFNRIFNSPGIDTFFQKLYVLKKTNTGIVTVVHIGDSHIASGYLPDEIRNGLQHFFGNPGKGDSFPGKPAGVQDAEKDDSTGVLYHAIGINGSRYESFNNSPVFWQQVSKLKADLVIVSLGTNEAHEAESGENKLLNQVSVFLENLKKASPAASVLITTAADSFKNGYPNRSLRNINLSLFVYCSSNNIPLWDMYRVTNGFGSAYNWRRKGMMEADGIHYTANAYKIQGRLLLNALARGYNNYVIGNPMATVQTLNYIRKNSYLIQNVK